MNFLAFLVILFVIIKVPVSRSCQVQLCYSDYLNLVLGYKQLQKYSVLRDLRPKEAMTQEYCKKLDSYGHCMKGLNKQCRGRLDYHAVIAHVKKWLEDYNCTASTSGLFKPSKTSAASMNLRQQMENARRIELQRQQQQSQDDLDSQQESQENSHNRHGRKGSKKCRSHHHHNQSPFQSLLSSGSSGNHPTFSQYFLLTFLSFLSLYVSFH